ncbi:InlB B-repeat-containing protein [Lactococcus raffinolactis]|uniref:InlB B-repeat-containing protein n=1 Tax=Pseudolactococcus raffinolactis TaxID=1366 RepID=UPI0024161156|nr:InlB B-repeat-containing protein [Lactococcus raffinolactis]MDG4962001.1 InlB B-repeat-containing protein [Lactococcus raffinolactis]
MKHTQQSNVRQKILSFMLGLSLLFNIFAPVAAVFAQDVAPPVAPVTSWQLTDANYQAVSEDNPIKSGVSYALTAEIHLQGLEGGHLVAGSTYQVKLPVNAEVGTWSGAQTTPKALVRKSGETVGSFVIQNQTVLLTLNETVAELDQVDAVIQTDAVLITDVNQDVTQAVQVGNISQTLAFEGAATDTTPELAKVKPALRATTATVDYSNQVVVNDWDLFNSAGALSTTNPASGNSYYKLIFSWTLTPSNTTLNGGDKFSFDRPTTLGGGSWSAQNYEWSDFSDYLGTVIGRWRITNSKIQVELYDSVAGRQSISGNFSSSSGAFMAPNIIQGGDYETTFGGTVKIIKFIQKTQVMNPLPSGDVKSAQNFTNAMGTWYIAIGRTEVKGLGTSFGTAYNNQTNVYIEDPLNATPNGTISLSASVNIPTNLNSGTLATQGKGFSVPITKISQNPGESYLDFKARLQVYQYGFYQDDLGKYTLVLYLGDIGNDGLRYSDLNSNYANLVANNFITAGYYSESDRTDLVDFLNTTYGNNNVISGKIASYYITFSEKFPQVAVNTQVRNTAKITKGGVSRDYSATGTLTAPSGSGGTVTSGSAGVYLLDDDTNLPLSGTFKLQKQQGDGSWIDYNAGATYTTDAANFGFVNAGAVGDGTFRFYQTAAPSSEYDLTNSPGYDASAGSVVSASFTVNAATDTAGKTVTVKNTKYKFNITYTKGNHGDFADNVFTGRVINSMTPSFSGTLGADGISPKGETGYTFTGWSPAVANTVTATVTYTAQWAPTVYDISYVLNGGNNSLSNPATYTYGVGVTSFADATGKTGYTFAGWYDDATAGNPVTTISTTETGNKTLYARWTPNEYDIVYHLDGGTNDSANPAKYTYDVGVASFEDATKDGYHFLGWYDAAEGGNLITNIATNATGTKDLYAHWDYTITYELDGGTNGANPTHYEFGTGVASFNPASKTGHDFQGWYDVATGGNKVTNIPATAKEDKTLYARFTPSEYTIAYELDGGTNSTANPDSYIYGVGVPSFEDATKDGYIFLGWFDAESGGNAITDISDTTMGNQTLYAHFKYDNARIEAKPIVRTIVKNTTYTWHHPEHEPVLYDEDNNVVPDADIWAIVDGVAYNATDAAELPEGVHDVTFTNVNPMTRFTPFNRLVTRATVREVTTHTTATILAVDNPIVELEPAPITVRYVDQSGKELKTATVYTGKIGDAITSNAPAIAGYELISLSDKINATITDQAQTFTFVYKPVTQTPALPTTDQQLPKTGESQSAFSLILGFILVALVSILTWFKLGKRNTRHSD